MKQEILRLLKEEKGYVSGQALCDRFQVSRTAVWKAVRQLEEEGYAIEAVRNRGYRLTGCPDRLTEEELGSEICGWAGRSICYREETESTNDLAKKLAAEGCPEGTLVTADYQSAGKGRRGRAWSSPKGEAVYMSLVRRPDLPPASASMVTLVGAMAVTAAVGRETGLSCQIKWPNDVVSGGRKVCGILTEMSAELDCIHYIVMGMGINTGQREFPEELREKATSLLLECGRPVNRCRLAAAVLEEFEGLYARFLEDGDLRGLAAEYNSRLAGLGREVRILDPAGAYTGVSRGIDEEGRLLVEMDGGDTRRVVSGEVSVRGLYGYV